jgi:multidrug efflux pump subunit AcrB
MLNQARTYGDQATHLEDWIAERKRERRVQPVPRTKTTEEIQLQDMEFAMTVVGLLAGACVFLCAMGLLAYWVSPWAVVSVISLAGVIASWTKLKGWW